MNTSIRGGAATLLRALCATWVLIAVAGCTSQPPVPQDRYYRLQAVLASAPVSSPVLLGTLEIERFAADGLTNGRPIVYVDADDPNQLLEYHYHFWTQSPSVMLRDELVTYLRAAKIATSVVTPEMRLGAKYIMTGRIRALEQRLGSTPSTVMEIEFAVRRPDDGTLMFLKSYRQETAQSSGGVAGAVDALNMSFNLILSDLLADLKAL